MPEISEQRDIDEVMARAASPSFLDKLILMG